MRQGQESAIAALRSVIRETMCRPGNWLTYESNTLRALVMNEDVRSLMSTQLRVNRHAYEMLVALGQEQGTIRRDLPVAQIADVAQTLMAGFTVVLVDSRHDADRGAGRLDDHALDDLDQAGRARPSGAARRGRNVPRVGPPRPRRPKQARGPRNAPAADVRRVAGSRAG